MLHLERIHHIAIICSDYARSRHFYTEILGLKVMQEVHRADRDSYKLDLSLNGQYVIELFSFPDPPKRLSGPEGRGLRHLAFAVKDISASLRQLAQQGIDCEPVRTDPYTQKQFTFFQDPDQLPIELYEI